MGLTSDIGRRIELVPMDPFFHNIAIGLYLQRREQCVEFLAHTYSRREGAEQRMESIAKAMTILGGMEFVSGVPRLLRFPCGVDHKRACRRVFLEACKLDLKNPVTVRPLSILDKKSNRNITAISLGRGIYQLTADGAEQEKSNRIEAVVGGLIKLGEMQSTADNSDHVAFSCGQTHDALVGLLLIRALNVRAVLREQEMSATRGILVAPSAQK